MPDLPLFWLPTKPFDVVAAINRRAAATGSIRTAALASSADYNGHAVVLEWNGYTRRYIGSYTWAGTQNVTRSVSFVDALEACKRFYARGGLGSSLVVYPASEADVAVCEADPDLKPYVESVYNPAHGRREGGTAAEWRATWPDAWKHDLIAGATEWRWQPARASVSDAALIKAATLEEYKAAMSVWEEQENARRNVGRRSA